MKKINQLSFKLLLTAFVIASVTTSCKKDDETSPNSTVSCQLTKSTDQKGHVQTFEYDTKGNLLKDSYLSENISDTREYDSNNRMVKLIRYEDGELAETRVIT